MAGHRVGWELLGDSLYELEFGVDDLAKTRFRISPTDHLAFGVISAGRGHYVGSCAARDRWWRGIRRHLPQRAALFVEVMNASSLWYPDSLSGPVASGRSRIGEELDHVLAITDEQFRADIDSYPHPQLPVLFRQLQQDGARGLRQIVDGAWALYRTCLAPDWTDIERTLQADIDRRARTFVEHGAGAMLEELHPRLSWYDTGILQYRDPAGFRESKQRDSLRGHGLELRLNLFLQDGLGWSRRPDGPISAFVPIARTANRSASTSDGLTAVLGAARARTLRVIGKGPHTTSELAAALHVASPSVSAQTNALRAAGLITTTRHGRSVHHALTPTGQDLVTQNPP
jgi:DNA-binding transcriptional ArsR family regulator